MNDPIDTKTLRSLVEAANLISEAPEASDPMSAFAKGAKSERKIGRVKAWISYTSKLEGYSPQEDVEYTRRIKSTIPNAHWYFIGGTPMCKMSRYDRRCRASVVFLITTDGMLLAEVYEDTSVSKGYYGRWQVGSHWTDTFADAKRHAESGVQGKLSSLAQEKEMLRKEGMLP